MSLYLTKKNKQVWDVQIVRYKLGIVRKARILRQKVAIAFFISIFCGKKMDFHREHRSDDAKPVLIKKKIDE